VAEPNCRSFATGPKYGKATQCTCLHKLRPTGAEGEEILPMIASHVVYFACLPKDTKMVLMIEWIRFGGIWERMGKPSDEQYHFMVHSSLPYEHAPDNVDEPEFWEAFSTRQDQVKSVKVCQNACRLLYGFGDSIWRSARDCAERNRIPTHGLKGKTSNRKTKAILDGEANLHKFLEDLANEAAEIPPTRVVRCLAGNRLRKEEEGLIELPHHFSKRSLYGRWMYEGGWLVDTNANGAITIRERQDEHWNDDEDVRMKYLSWTAFHTYWKKEFPKMSIRPKSEDVCGECQIVAMRFKFASFRQFIDSGVVLPNTDAADLLDLIENSGVEYEYCQPCGEQEEAKEDDGSPQGAQDNRVRGGDGVGGRDGAGGGG